MWSIVVTYNCCLWCRFGVGFGLVQFVVHVFLYRPLKRVGQELGKGVEEMSDTVRPVQDKSLGLGEELSQDVKDTLHGGGGRKQLS